MTARNPLPRDRGLGRVVAGWRCGLTGCLRGLEAGQAGRRVLGVGGMGPSPSIAAPPPARWSAPLLWLGPRSPAAPAWPLWLLSAWQRCPVPPFLSAWTLFCQQPALPLVCPPGVAAPGSCCPPWSPGQASPAHPSAFPLSPPTQRPSTHSPWGLARERTHSPLPDAPSCYCHDPFSCPGPSCKYTLPPTALQPS